MTDNPPALSPSFVSRVKGILLQPAREWEIIRGEPATVKGLFVGYAVPLALIGPVCGLIGGQLFGVNVLGAVYRTPILGAIVGAVVAYGLALLGAYLLGLVIEALAPSFGGTKDRLAAMKVAVYSSTASWLAGVFGIIPALAVLGILGLYSLYLLYTGLSPLMNAPKDKTVVYAVVVVIAAVVIYLVIGAVVGAVVGGLALGGAAAVGSVVV